jgi:ribosomal 30S subunit maturation factor RimM
VLIPVVRDVVVSVDVEAKRIVVREVPGLTAPEE